MTKEAGNASEFSRVAEAARPQAMATERDMLPLRVSELQEVRPAMAALYDFTAIKAALVAAELAIPVSPSGESGTRAMAAPDFDGSGSLVAESQLRKCANCRLGASGG